jgi:hypothetical protein
MREKFVFCEEDDFAEVGGQIGEGGTDGGAFLGLPTGGVRRFAGVGKVGRRRGVEGVCAAADGLAGVVTRQVERDLK